MGGAPQCRLCLFFSNPIGAVCGDATQRQRSGRTALHIGGAETSAQEYSKDYPRCTRLFIRKTLDVRKIDVAWSSASTGQSVARALSVSGGRIALGRVKNPHSPLGTV